MNFHILTTVSAAAALCLSIPQAQATREEAQFLRTVAEQYMLAQFRDQGDGSRIEVQAAGLDARRDYGGPHHPLLAGKDKLQKARARF